MIANTQAHNSIWTVSEDYINKSCRDGSYSRWFSYKLLLQAIYICDSHFARIIVISSSNHSQFKSPIR